MFYRISKDVREKDSTGRSDITVVTEVNSRKIDRKSEKNESVKTRGELATYQEEVLFLEKTDHTKLLEVGVRW